MTPTSAIRTMRNICLPTIACTARLSVLPVGPSFVFVFALKSLISSRASVDATRRAMSLLICTLIAPDAYLAPRLALPLAARFAAARARILAPLAS